MSKVNTQAVILVSFVPVTRDPAGKLDCAAVEAWSSEQVGEKQKSKISTRVTVHEKWKVRNHLYQCQVFVQPICSQACTATVNIRGQPGKPRLCPLGQTWLEEFY